MNPKNFIQFAFFIRNNVLLKIENNFYTLGGQSLQATKLLAIIMVGFKGIDYSGHNDPSIIAKKVLVA